MKIKTKTDLDFDIAEIVLNVETNNIIVPVFPVFKRPSLNKQVFLKPVPQSFRSSPSKHDDSLSSSTKISAINTASYQHNYIVNKFVKTMQKHLHSPNRSEVEGQIVKNLITQNGKLIYMLHIDWATNYTDYLQHKLNTPPGPINNTQIFADNTTESNYKQNLKQDVDFVLMNANTWLFILAVYGGGPQIFITDYMKETQALSHTGSINMDNNSLRPSLSRVSSIQSGMIETQSYISLNFPFQKSQFELPPVGFYNEHNFCFMHAALQSLLTVEQINCWMMNDGQQVIKQGGNLKFLLSYWEIVQQVSTKKAGAFIKIQTLKQLIKDSFDPKLQHDSQEFLRYYIEQLSSDISGQEKYDQPITDIVFQGQMMSLIDCQGCQYKSSKLESFLDLSLSMTGTLDGSLRQFFAREFLNDNYQCENCNKITKAIKRYVIGTPPQYLMIHLKRFQIIPHKVKLHGHVKFPIILDVEEYCSIKVKYKLRSVIVHYGTHDKGHYVNFSQRQNQWYYFDDHKVYLVNEQDVLSQQAYVLFYEKVEEYLLDMQ